MRRQTHVFTAAGLSFVAVVICIGIPALFAERATAANTLAAKTYWHKVGNDRFRAYDVGGVKNGDGKLAPVTATGYPYGPSGPGYTAYSGEGKSNAGPNKRYAERVDWPVTFIFKNASISTVKKGLARQGLSKTGGTQYMSLMDSTWAMLDGNPYRAWDEDKGLKQVSCSSVIGLRDTWHIRLYADSLGHTEGTSDDRMYNMYWKFYVLGTTHIDHLECPPTPWTWFGKSEDAEWYISRLAAKQWGDGSVRSDAYDMKNFESNRTEGDHVWSNNGWATVVDVGVRASAAGSPDDDPNPEGGEGGEGEEGPPPPDPAIDSDVNGDNHADLVTLHTSGVAHTLNAFDAADKVTTFGGGMNSALFDGSEHHVVDVSDVTGDHHADLVTLCFNSPLGIDNSVCVFPGQSDNSFGSGVLARGEIVPGTLSSGGHEPIGVADVNGDLRGDLVTFYAPQGNFYVYPGLPNNQFGDGITVGGGQVNSALFDRTGTYFLDVGDVNGDGHADVVGTSSSGKAEVFPGGPGGIQQSSRGIGPTADPIMADGSGHEPIGLGDVNKDGKADLVTLNPSGSISVYAGMQAADQYLATTAVTSQSSQNSSLMDETGDDFVGLLDRTGDGHADLMKVNSEGVVYSASGQGDLKFGNFAYFSNGLPSNRFAKAGHEQVFEKPFIRRIGCSPAGCIDRPRAMDADVDGDLRSDLVTLDKAGTAHTYRAIGEIGHKASLTGALNPALFDRVGHFVADVADVNGDWRADKVTLGDNGYPYVHPGNTDGSFGTGVVSPSAYVDADPYRQYGSDPIGVADVTGDMLGDLVVFSPSHGIKVYRGNSNNTFSAAVTSLPGVNSALYDGVGYHFLDVVDVTGDRKADLVASSAQDNTVRVFRGNANGTFLLDGVVPLSLKLDDGPGQELVGLGDVNGDRRVDLTTLVSGTVNVYEGRLGGEFVTEDANGPTPAGTSFSGSMDSNLFDKTGDEIVGLLDENGDRKADLVTVRADGSARIYRGKADFTFEQTAKVRTLPEFSPVRFNKPTGHEVASEKPAIHRSGCTPTDCPWPPIPFQTVEEDVDGDYRADLVTLDSSGSVNLFPGARAGFGTTPTTSLAGQLDPALHDGIGHYVIDTADVSNDGLTDLVTLKDDGKVSVHLAQGNRTFGAAVSTGISLPPVMNKAGLNEPIAVADITGDGFEDLVAFSGSGAGSIKVFVGLSGGKFSTTAVESLSGAVQSALLEGEGLYFLDVVDTNNDGRADLVAVSTGGAIRIFKGQATGAFAAGIWSQVVNPVLDDGEGAEPIGLGDVNGDGKVDLVTLSESIPTLYRGLGNGEFSPAPGFYAAGLNSSLMDGVGKDLIGLLDYNGDGRDDLVALDQNGNLLTYGSEPGGLNSPFSRSSSLVSSRDAPTGSEFGIEKPLVRRKGCVEAGCAWLGVKEDPTIQRTPLGAKRVGIGENRNIDINRLDDKRADVDVAVLASGIDVENTDLDVVEGANCLGATVPTYACVAGSPKEGDDYHAQGLGTRISLHLAALDNGYRTPELPGVGVATGARLWAVRAASPQIFTQLGEATAKWQAKEAWTAPLVDLRPTIAGVKWVTARAAQIEVLHLALLCTTESNPSIPQPVCINDSGQVAALDAAIDQAIAAGVVVVAPAGDWDREISGSTSNSIPARHPSAITVSAMFDSDGVAGGEGSAGPACNPFFPAEEEDDTGSDGSHYGAAIDIAAPGPCTSDAAAYVSGAAALLASAKNPANAADVAAIRNALVAAGNTKPAAEDGWDDESGDSYKEPLLDLGDEGVFDPVYISPYLAPNPAMERPKAVKDAVTGQPCGDLTIDWPEVSGGCVVEDVQASSFTYRTTSSSCGVLELGELHIDSEGNFAADHIYASCPTFGAERCDVAPRDYLHYFPARQAKSSIHRAPWTGLFFQLGGVRYAYIAVCLTVTKKGPDAKWVDYVLGKVSESTSGGKTSYAWSFVSSGSKEWETESFGYFATGAWMQAPGALIEW